jgi:arylsulfatase A-like enzyme
MNSPSISTCGSSEHLLYRRSFLQSVLAANATLQIGGLGMAAETPTGEALRRQHKRALFIWLAGGSSQFETWDPKPGRETGGPFRPIQTAVPGYQVCELMPKLAGLMQKIAVVRSLNTVITAHEPAADLISTGRPKEAALDYPEMGVVLAKELASQDSLLPDYVSFFLSTEGRRRPATGFLGGRHAPLLLEKSMRPGDIDLPSELSDLQHKEREDLRQRLSSEFANRRAGSDLVNGYNSAYAKVRGLMRTDHLFDLDREPAATRERYGRTEFGQQCLLARRLLEAGVPMVKVARGFWDSHHDNFECHRDNYRERHDLYHGTEELHREGAYATDIFADAAIEFVTRHSVAGQPWFCYLPFNAPHFPTAGNKRNGEPNIWQAPDDAFKAIGLSPAEADPRKRYEAVVFALDRAIGRVLKKIDENGQAKNTFVFFMSDNGAFRLNRKGLDVGINDPLRSGGVTCWEGGLRVAAMARWPGHIKPGSVLSEPFWSPDPLPTCAKLARAVLPADVEFDGSSAIPLLVAAERPSPHKSFYFEYRSQAALRMGDWKIVRERPNQPWQLYNLKDDERESKDLAAARPDQVQKLVAEIRNWKTKLSHE